LSFEEAGDKVRPLKISSSREYMRLFKQNKLPRGLPSNPPKMYKNKGWIGWPEFLGYERDKIIRGSALPFRVYIHSICDLSTFVVKVSIFPFVS
jgi:hypothetical protein